MILVLASCSIGPEAAPSPSGPVSSPPSGKFRVTAEIKVDNEPSFVAITPDGSKALVPTVQGVNVIDLKSKEVAISVKEEGPYNKAVIFPNGKEAIFARLGLTLVGPTIPPPKNIRFFDLENYEPTADPLSVDFFQNVAILPSGTEAWAVSSIAGKNQLNKIVVIDLKSHQITTTFPTPEFAMTFSCHFTPDGKYALLIHGEEGISLVDVKTHTVTATFLEGKNPSELAVAPDGKKALVMDITNNSVYFLDLKTGSVTTTLAIKHPSGVAITPDGALGLVSSTNDDTVRVVDVESSFIDTVKVGKGPGWMAVTPDGGQALVVNGTDNTVSVINLK